MTVDEEIARIRTKKMEREINRLNPEHLDTLRKRKKEAKDYKESIENEQK